MFFLYFLGLLIVCHGLPIDQPPNNVKVFPFITEKDSGFAVNWTKVEDTDDADPILGYKVFVWEEEISYAYELKEDGTLEPRAVEKLPSIISDIGLSALFELKPNAKWVAMNFQGMGLKVWQRRIKFVYKFKPDGTLDPIKDVDIPALKLRHDSSTKVTELSVPADKTELFYRDAKKNFIYEIAVQAFTSKSVSPLSEKVKLVYY